VLEEQKSYMNLVDVENFIQTGDMSKHSAIETHDEQMFLIKQAAP